MVVFGVFVALAGVIFVIGWVQLALEADQIAVVFSKTNGWEATAIVPGTFQWRWQRLVPTNLSVFVYPDVQHTTHLHFSSELDSASIYAQYLADTPSFSFEVELEINYSLPPDSLVQLTIHDGLRPGNLQERLSVFDAVVSQIAIETIETAVDAVRGDEPLRFSDILAPLTTELNERVSAVRIRSIRPVRFLIPDLKLYSAARDAYFTVLDRESAALAEARAAIRFDSVQEAHQLTTLERYGGLLMEFPVLMEYFTLEADPLNIQRLIEGF